MADFESINIYDTQVNEFKSSLSKLLASKNWFSIWGPIDPTSVEAAALFLLTKFNEGIKEITIVVNSPGGSEDDARGLISIMEICKAQGMVIRMFGCGMVGSAAFDIFIAGTRGYRFVHEVSMLMTHASSADIRNKAEIRLQEELDELTLTKFTKIKKAEREMFLNTGDWFMSPAEAVTRGVADAIVGLGEKLPDGPVFQVKKPREEKVEPSNVDQNT